jgi:hypothetical protein
MENIVRSVKTIARIVFSNETDFTLPFLNKDSQKSDLKNYGTGCSIKERLYSSDSTSVIGNVCTNTLSINLKSEDKKLISSNKNSDFYGYMNNTAVIYLSAVGDDGVETDFGKYYIDAWENGASSDKHAEVNITASDLFGRVKNMNIGKVRLKEHLTFSSYLISVINALNKSLPSNMQIKYIQSELEKLDSIYSTNWQMWFNNIERNDLETILNTIAKNTLTYIWIDRSETLRVDCLLDDEQEQPVCDVSGSTNLFSYKVNNADIYSYDGVRTTYISNVSYSDQEVLSLTEYSLVEGTNIVTARLNTSKCVNVHHIEIECDTGTAKCLSFYSFRDTIEMNIISDYDSVVNIKVYGTVINESYDTYTNKDYEKGTLLEIDNHIMSGKSNIETFTEYFNSLIAMDNAQIQVEGYINPQVALGDMINTTGTKLEIDNAYKVIGLDFKLGSSYRCTASLVRTV